MDFMEQTYQRTGLGPNWDGLGGGLRETSPPATMASPPKSWIINPIHVNPIKKTKKK